MIRFSLHCDNAHEFDGWFRNNDDFEKQNKTKLISCPVCGSASIAKTLMAPAVSTSRTRERIMMGVHGKQQDMLATVREIALNIRKKADYVGDNFAEEARKIHFGEVNARAIYGEASGQEVSELLEDGVDILPLPKLPEDKN